jgi:flagellar basal-body rod protein FlgB
MKGADPHGLGSSIAHGGRRKESCVAISVVDPTQSVLVAAMRGAELRQTLLTGDLANADTPDFEPQDVDFQSQLASAIQQGSSLGSLGFQASTDPQATSANGNGVDADETSADLADNGLLYDALSQVLTAHDQTLQFAMGIS